MSQVPDDHFTVKGFITTGIPFASHRQTSKERRVDALKGIPFLGTWCKEKDKGKGVATTVPPKHLNLLGGTLDWMRVGAYARLQGI